MMYRRAFFIPSIVLLFIGAMFGLLASISMQLVPGLDVVRSDLAIQPDRAEQISRITVPWGACTYMMDGAHTCTSSNGGGYEFAIVLLDKDGTARVIDKAWTRGLALVPIALAFATAALLLTFIPGKSFFKAARWVTYLCHLSSPWPDGSSRSYCSSTHSNCWATARAPVPGFWMSYSSVVALISASIAQWMGKRRMNHDQDELTGEGTRPAPPPPHGKTMDWNAVVRHADEPANGGAKKDGQVMWAPSPRRETQNTGPYTGMEKGEDGRPWEYGAAPPMPNNNNNNNQYGQPPQSYGYDDQQQQHHFGHPEYPGEQYDLPDDDGVSVYPQTAIAAAPPPPLTIADRACIGRGASLDRSRSRSGTPGPSLPSTPRPQPAVL
ncbi:hypothetical protein BKA62DRAFT_718652 [Auriculariales sp. MPI-PUGE-AT-0066]|nr:hypothetical protein BKA62DRAFT_718652 [Auriculariales sp. MPI-PUGE-AT-0066]